MAETIRYCPDCGHRRFEQPHAEPGSCPDAPDGCCAEWACTECGAALLIGYAPYPAVPAQTREPSRHVA